MVTIGKIICVAFRDRNKGKVIRITEDIIEPIPISVATETIKKIKEITSETKENDELDQS
jgi:Cu2+-containing amine oxidase